jgi:hypothetical protein
MPTKAGDMIICLASYVTIEHFTIFVVCVFSMGSKSVFVLANLVSNVTVDFVYDMNCLHVVIQFLLDVELLTAALANEHA